MTDVAPASPTIRRRKQLAIAVVMGIALLLLTALVFSGQRPSLSPKLPDPNGFDDLVAAGSRIQGEWPAKGDIEKADRGAMRAFVDSNRAALDLARVGLGRDCLVHFEDSEAGLTRQIEGDRRLKDVARLLTIEGLVAESEGRIGDASRSFQAVMEVGQALTQDGMMTDALLGWFLQKLAGDRLRKLLDRLPKDDLKATIRDLESPDRRRVSAGAVVARWERWYRGAFSSIQRTMMGWNGLEASERGNQQNLAKKAHDEATRDLRFLMIHLAIHAHHLDKGTWPRSVQDLAPAYLSSAPIDPGTGKPIDYPANPSGELTDDLSDIGRPGGEVTTRP